VSRADLNHDQLTEDLFVEISRIDAEVSKLRGK